MDEPLKDSIRAGIADRALALLGHVEGRRKQDRAALESLRALLIRLQRVDDPPASTPTQLLPPGCVEGRRNLRPGDWGAGGGRLWSGGVAMETMAVWGVRAPIMTTVDGAAVYAAPLTTPEAYAERWSKRAPGTWASEREIMASVHVETTCGVEIEVSARVELRGRRTTIDDARCRVVDGAEVELDDEVLDGLVDRLAWAAADIARVS